MNVAFFLTPKHEVASLFDDQTIRRGLETMRRHGFSALPVTTRENKYVGTISEGDFLWFLLEAQNKITSEEEKEMLWKTPIRAVLSQKRNPPVKITVSMDELLERVMSHNFVPVIDDNNSFIGIVTRRGIIRYFIDKEDSRSKIG